MEKRGQQSGTWEQLQADSNTDRIWKGGMAAMLILFFLFLAAVWKGNVNLILLAFIYGTLNFIVFILVYFRVARSINQVLYQLGDMMECLIGGRKQQLFSIAEDTVLSKLQGQLLRLYDILRSYEEREQKLRKQLDENIGNLVHQINTPVTNIGIYAGFLKRDDLTAEERVKFTGCMEEQAAKLSWLGESFSRISRMETGIIRLKPEKQDVLPIILRAVNQVMEKAEHKGMEIELKGDKQSVVLADAKWTAEAIFNVLDNAVKYGNRGSKIEIDVSELTSYTCIAVRNRGIVIDKKEYHAIFRRFFRGKEAGAEEGVGLGLYIAREILEKENGYIEVKTLPDARTEFNLYIRRVKGYHGISYSR